MPGSTSRWNRAACAVDSSGRIIREIKVASEPEALVGFFAGLGVAVTRIGLEAGPLSQCLHAGLTGAGFEAVLLETRHEGRIVGGGSHDGSQGRARHRPAAPDGLVP